MVVMFDLKTFTVLGRIPAAEDADAIIYDGASNRIFTFNGDAHSSTVIDPRAGTLITNIPLGGKPEYGHQPATARCTGTSRTRARWWRLTRRPRRWLDAGPRLRASSQCRWRSTPGTTVCSAGAAAA